jgi:hypothetical protein
MDIYRFSEVDEKERLCKDMQDEQPFAPRFLLTVFLLLFLRF